MTIDLRNAKPGDRFEVRNGEVWTYVGREALDDSLHVLTDRFTVKGYFREAKNGFLRVLEAPTPAEPEQGDAELVAELRHIERSWRSIIGDEPTTPSIAAGKAATRIEVLTRAVEEAKAPSDVCMAIAKELAAMHVEGTDAETEYDWDQTDEFWRRSFIGKAVRIMKAAGLYPAARDWVKGGKADA